MSSGQTWDVAANEVQALARSGAEGLVLKMFLAKQPTARQVLLQVAELQPT